MERENEKEKKYSEILNPQIKELTIHRITRKLNTSYVLFQ